MAGPRPAARRAGAGEEAEGGKERWGTESLGLAKDSATKQDGGACVVVIERLQAQLSHVALPLTAGWEASRLMGLPTPNRM